MTNAGLRAHPCGSARSSTFSLPAPPASRTTSTRSPSLTASGSRRNHAHRADPTRKRLGDKGQTSLLTMAVGPPSIHQTHQDVGGDRRPKTFRVNQDLALDRAAVQRMAALVDFTRLAVDVTEA